MKGDDPIPFEATFVRSVRRALRKMVDNKAIVALGKGGPRKPHRYSVDLMIAVMAIEDQEAFTALAGAMDDAEA
jgi:hypothetical protein